MKNFHFHFLPLNLLWTKCAIFFGLTLTAPIIVMSPSGRTCDMYKIILQLKWKGNFKMWKGGTLPWEPGRELSGRHHQSETCAVYFLSRQFKKSERPVDALAENGKSLTHPLTAWNQEMLAHLKVIASLNRYVLYTHSNKIHQHIQIFVSKSTFWGVSCCRW